MHIPSRLRAFVDGMSRSTLNINVSLIAGDRELSGKDTLFSVLSKHQSQWSAMVVSTNIVFPACVFGGTGFGVCV